jgi:hypothetical protein
MDELMEEVLTLVKKKMIEQGGYDHEAYREFISETIEYFKEKGKITEDDNYEMMEKQLLDMWEDVKDGLAE